MFKSLIVTIGLMGVFVGTTNAAPLIVNSGDFNGTFTSGEGGGRAQAIRADTSFSVSSIGIFGGLISQSFDLRIHASTTGADVGSLLANSSAVVGGDGIKFHDINIDFTFSTGDIFIVQWRPTSNGAWATSMDYYFDRSLPITLGPLTLLRGLEGFNLEHPNNTLHPNFRYDIVSAIPEPTTALILAIGLISLAGARRYA